MAENGLSGLSTTDLYKAAAMAEGYESVPVDIDTFLNDPYYLGQIYGNGQVYPYWMDALHKVFPNPLYSPYEEVCVTGCPAGLLLSPQRGSLRAARSGAYALP